MAVHFDLLNTGFLSKVLTAYLRPHDMAEVEQMHPKLEEGDVLIGDRVFCSFVHLTLLMRSKLRCVYRAHQKQIVNFRIGRFHNRPQHKPVKGLPYSH